MIRRDATLIITILAITITAPVYAEDTQIFGGGSVNVPRTCSSSSTIRAVWRKMSGYRVRATNMTRAPFTRAAITGDMFTGTMVGMGILAIYRNE